MLDPEFVADCFYGPEGQVIDEILEIDTEGDRVVARMPSHADLPLTRHQRAHPVRHPRHVSGGLMIHVAGVMGYVHFYYVLGLRHADGWVGYGTRVVDGRFHALAEPGSPLVLECRVVRMRRGRDRIVGRYQYRFTQDERLVYEGEHVAMWQKVELGEAGEADAS